LKKTQSTEIFILQVCELHPQDVVFKDQKDAQKMYRFNDLSLVQFLPE